MNFEFLKLNFNHLKRNSLFEYFKTENKQIHEKHFENSLHFFSTLRNKNIIDNEKKAEGTKEFTQSLPFFRSNPKNIGKIATLVQTADKIDNIKIEKIDFRTFFKKDLKNQLLPEINLKKRKQAITDKIFLVSENKIKKELQERTKFLNIIKQKGKIPREKIKQIGTDLLLDLNNVKITNLSDSANLEDEKKHDIDKNCTLTFDEITKKLLDSKNNMARDLLILKEMKLAQDIDLTKSNLSNFRVTQKEIIINFIKRKKREYSTMNFDYNDKNLNERISKKFKKTVYLIMDKLSKMKLSVDEVK